MSLGSCAAVLKTASRANPVVHLPYRPRLRATPHRPSRNVRRYDWTAASGSVVDADPINRSDPTGLCEQCREEELAFAKSLKGMTPDEMQAAIYDRAATQLPILLGFAAPELIGARAIVVLGRPSWLQRAWNGVKGFFGGKTAAQQLKLADAALPAGMTRAEFAKLAGFENSLTSSAAASAKATSATVESMTTAGIGKSNVKAWQKFYDKAYKAEPKNLAALHRKELLKSILKAW